MRALDRRGEPALKALRAATLSPDAEVRHRAALLVQRIEERLEIARVLGGKKLRLVYNDVAIFDAINDFSAKAGINLDVEGDRLGMRERRITLDTGEVTFWEAYELFCAKAGLRERKPHGMATGNSYEYGGRHYPASGSSTIQQPLRVALEDAKAAALPTAYCGALRLRAVAPPTSNGPPPVFPPVETPQAVGFYLEATAEPRFAWQGLVSLRITRAVDEHDQLLAPCEPSLVEDKAPPMVDGAGALFIIEDERLAPAGLRAQQLTARLKPGKQPAQYLKEVQGTLAVQVTAMRDALSIDNVFQCVGKEFRCGTGTTVQVTSARSEGGCYQLRVTVGKDTPTTLPEVIRLKKAKDPNAAPGIEVVGADSTADSIFQLVDCQGRPLAPQHSNHGAGLTGQGGYNVGYSLVFAIPKDAPQGPWKLCYRRPTVLTVDVPFTLRDVPLVDNPWQTPETTIPPLLTR